MIMLPSKSSFKGEKAFASGGEGERKVRSQWNRNNKAEGIQRP